MKSIRFLWIVNQPFPQSVADQTALRLRAWLRENLGVNAEFVFAQSAFPQRYEQVHPKYKGLSWKLFDQNPYAGLARNTQAAFLFHDPAEEVQGIANFTIQDSNGTMTWLDDRVKIQIAWNTRWSEEQLFDIILHELGHALHRILWLNGIRTTDTLDDGVDGEAPEIGRQRFLDNIARIKPHADKLTEPIPLDRVLTWVSMILVEIRKQIDALVKKAARRPTLRELAQAMARWETGNFRPETLPMRLNNPTALRWSRIQDGVYEATPGNRYARFNTMDRGWLGAVTDLTDKRAGRSSWAHGETTLSQLIKKWSGGENWERYLRSVCTELNVPDDIRLKDFAIN